MVKIRQQSNYYVTETSFETPVNLKDVEALIHSTKSTGKMTVTVNNGGVQGVTVEQKTRISPADDQRVRDLIGIGTIEVERS